MVKEYKDMDFMEFLEIWSGTVTSGVAVNVSIDIPVVPDERIALLIHKLLFTNTEINPAASTSSMFRATLGLAPGIIEGTNPLALAEYWVQATALNATPRPGVMLKGADQQPFEPPILVARRTLWLYIWSDGNHETTFEVGLKIGYTLVKVPLDRMLRALVE